MSLILPFFIEVFLDPFLLNLNPFLIWYVIFCAILISLLICAYTYDAMFYINFVEIPKRNWHFLMSMVGVGKTQFYAEDTFSERMLKIEELCGDLCNTDKKIAKSTDFISSLKSKVYSVS